MTTFYAVLKNNYKRTVSRIGTISIITIISLLTIVLAIYMSTKAQPFANIAIVGQKNDNIYTESEKVLHITYLDTKPELSDLYKLKYDAYIAKNDSGTNEITSLKSEEFNQTILALLANPGAQIPDTYARRGAGETIIGFILLFLLAICLGNMFAFADDKEQGQMKRIFSAPTSFVWYIFAHIFYSESLLLPQFLFIVLLKLLKFNIGLTIWEYFFIILLIGFLGSSFALLLNTLINKPNNASMFGNSIIILTSILAGTFYSFHKDNKLMDYFLALIPQKQIMNIVSQLSDIRITTMGSMIYVFSFSFIALFLSCFILNVKYVKKS